MALWVAAERLPQFAAIHPNAVREPHIEAPAEYAATEWTPDKALVEIIRSRLTGLGPVRVADLAASLGVPTSDIDIALAALEGEGYVMRGQFTPGASETEWCERRLLARIHRYTVRRLRREIEPVEPRDYHALPRRRGSTSRPTRASAGPTRSPSVLAQLEGYEAPAAAWESELLPARVAGYEISWLDDLCLSGRVLWARLRGGKVAQDGATTPASAAGPVRATPIVLLQRRHLADWSTLGGIAAGAEPALSSRAKAVADYLTDHGASFFDEMLGGTRLLHTELEDALGELVASGLVTSRQLLGPARAAGAVEQAAAAASPARTPRLAVRHRRCGTLGDRAPRGRRRRNADPRRRSRRARRAHVAQALRRRLLATARERGRMAAAVARSAARFPPARSARRDPRRPFHRGPFGRAVRAARGGRLAARDPAEEAGWAMDCRLRRRSAESRRRRARRHDDSGA